MNGAPAIDRAQWQRLKPLLTSALRLPAAERAAFFAEHLGSDPALQSCALEMLKLYDETSKSFSAGTRQVTPSNDAAPQPGAELNRTALIGHYRVVRTLGEGGMGRVYLARDERLGRLAALKLLHPSVSRGLEAGYAAAIAESRSISALNHPGIVILYDVFEHEGELILAMEYVDGRPLSELIAEGPVPTAFALRLVEQIADAVAYAHGRGVLHCDLKPSNIFVLPTGTTKILDFGLARIVTGRQGEEETRTARIVGTPGYLSPEQLNFRAPTPASDMYALGVVAFELLTGTAPFKHDDQEQLLFDTIAVPAPLPSSIVPSLPPAVDDIVSRCLAKNPRERLQAHELAQAVRSVHAGDAPLARPVAGAKPSGEEPPRTHGVRRRLLLAACIVGLLGLALGTAVWRDGLGMRWPWRSSSLNSGLSEPVSLAILPTTGTLHRPEDTALANAMPTLLRPALSRLGGVNVSVLNEDRVRPGTPPQTAMKNLGATLGVRCVLSTRGERDTAAIEVLADDGAPFFHEDVTVDAQNPGRTLEDVVRTVERGVATRVPRAAATSGVRTEGLTPSPLALAQFTQAVDMLERPDVPGNVERAIVLLESATQKDPSSALAYAALARARWMNYIDTRSEESAHKAQAAVMTALSLDNMLVPVKLSAATIERDMGELDRAESTLNEAIAMVPTSDEAHRLLGETLVKRGERDRAQQEFDKAIALRPLYWRNHRAKGLAYYDAGEFDRAAASFTRVTELQPDNAWGYQMLGATRQQRGDYAGAVAAYEQSLKVAPGWAAWSNIAKLHYDNHEYQKAVDAYRQALTLRKAYPLNWRNLGDVLTVMGRSADAKEAYLQGVDFASRTVQMNPSDADTLSTLAVLHAKLGNRKEAVAEATKATTLAPGNRTVRFRQAVVLMFAGDRAGAQAALNEALRLGYSLSEAKLDRDLQGLKFEAPSTGTPK